MANDLLRLLDRLGLPGQRIKGVFLHLFGPKGDTTGLLRILMIVVFFLVGFLEVLSILFRPISLSSVSTAISLPGRTCWKRWGNWCPCLAG